MLGACLVTHQNPVKSTIALVKTWTWNAVALVRMFPSHDWSGTPASETISRKPGSEYTLAEWLPPTKQWAPCGQEALKILCNGCQAKTKKP